MPVVVGVGYGRFTPLSYAVNDWQMKAGSNSGIWDVGPAEGLLVMGPCFQEACQEKC